jgi:hypothetical protein
LIFSVLNAIQGLIPAVVLGVGMLWLPESPGAFVFSYRLVPETKGRALEEIEP